MKILQKPSPNSGDRAGGRKPAILVMHYTDTKNIEDTLAILQSKEREVSAHYAVDVNGDVYQLVDEGRRAWHAGKSCWEGERDINSASIGIEIQNPGHQFGYTPFPDAQMKAVLALSRGIIARHNIKAHHILAHSDIAPLRKKDPGELFPWQWLAEQGIGLWPQTEKNLWPAAAAGDGDVAALLKEYGYDPDVDTAALVSAFQRHFEPEKFSTGGTAGVADKSTIGKIKSLLRQKQAAE